MIIDQVKYYQLIALKLERKSIVLMTEYMNDRSVTSTSSPELPSRICTTKPLRSPSKSQEFDINCNFQFFFTKLKLISRKK